VLLGLGTFLITMAALVKWYAYPTLAVVPLDHTAVSTSVGQDMTYFSAADLEEKTDTLTSTLRVVGDVKAAQEEGDDVAVWNKSTVTTTSDGTVISAETIRVPFDRTSAESLDCCDANVDDVATNFDGLVFKFPFNTQKQAYPWWDEDLGTTVELQYDGTEEIDGLTTYRFTGTVDPTAIGTQALPSRVIGLPEGSMVTTEEWYANGRTFWVEPETGVIIKAIENPNTVFRYQGEDKVIKTRGTTGFDDETIQANVDEYKSKATQLHLLRVLLPNGGVALGVLALLVGGFVVASTGRARRKAEVAAKPAAANAR